jgi:DNA replication protein DnaC
MTGSEWLDDILFKLLDYRMTNKRMTLFTSNCPINELRFNERTIDRVNRLSMPCKLPEICVRDKEVNEARASLIRKLGLNKKPGTDDGGENKSMPV